MDKSDWIKDYFSLYQKSIFNENIHNDLILLQEQWLLTAKNNKKLIFVGNGGSAALSSHCAVDFTKNAGIRSINFNEADLITCFSNDYGYENWVSAALEFYADEGDSVILISSSGNSENLVNGALKAKEMNTHLTTFTGFTSDNLLKRQGDINLWVESTAYNVVEMTHHIWILSICDMIIGDAFYSAN